MGGRRTVRLGSGAEQLERRRKSRLLIALPIIVAALTLMALGAVLAEVVAHPSGLSLNVPRPTAAVGVWLAVLAVVGSVLIVIQRKYGTGWALLALGVLMGVALLATSAGELAAFLGWEPL